MKSITNMTIMNLTDLHPVGMYGPLVKRCEKDAIPDRFRLIASVRDLELTKSGLAETHSRIFIDDFRSLADAEAFAARMMQTFPSITRSGVSDIGETIRLAVATSFEVPSKHIQSRSTKRSISKPRHATSYLGRTIRTASGDDGLSLHEVGRITGRDHTTVIASIKVATTHIDRRDRSPAYNEFATRLCRAERTLRCAGFGFHHDGPIAAKMGA